MEKCLMDLREVSLNAKKVFGESYRVKKLIDYMVERKRVLIKLNVSMALNLSYRY